MRHEAETKANAYWLGLLAHLQASTVPRKVNCKYNEAQAHIVQVCVCFFFFFVYNWKKTDTNC